MKRKNRHWIVFGAQDKGDKSVLAYKDRKTGMYALKILQNTGDCDYQIGDMADTSYPTVVNETEGEYTTMFFASKNGIKSIEVLIKQLEYLKSMMEKDVATVSELIPPSAKSEISITCGECKWYSADICERWRCYNEKSDCFTDFMDYSDTCPCFQERGIE